MELCGAFKLQKKPGNSNLLLGNCFTIPLRHFLRFFTMSRRTHMRMSLRTLKH